MAAHHRMSGIRLSSQINISDIRLRRKYHTMRLITINIFYFNSLTL